MCHGDDRFSVAASSANVPTRPTLQAVDSIIVTLYIVTAYAPTDTPAFHYKLGFAKF